MTDTTIHNNKEVLEYWNQQQVESMYDKNLINLEIELIKRRIAPDSKVLDAGCGEGEGTLVYAQLPGTTVHGADFSGTRLEKARSRLHDQKNVRLHQVDFLGSYSLDDDYDTIVSQRFLINLMEWKLQQKVLLALMGLLKKGGRLLMLEGSLQGVEELNRFRSLYDLEPIPVKWHNLFFDDTELKRFMNEHRFRLVEEDGLGDYFLLTRGVRPVFDENLAWDSPFNKVAASQPIRQLLGLKNVCSRLKLWVFCK